MSLKTTIKQLLPNSWILKRQRMKAAIQLRKDVHTDRRLCGSRMRLSNAICLRELR